MQIKNNKKLYFIHFVIFLLMSVNLNAEEFNITAKEIIIDKENQILTGSGDVQAIDSEGKIIEADKIIYKKSEEFLQAEGQVKISDLDGNVLKGIVEDIAYGGSFSTYHVKLDNGRILKAIRANRVRTEEHHLTWDDEVYLHWSPDSAVVLLS